MRTLLIPVLAGAVAIGFFGPYLVGRYWPDPPERSRGLQLRAGHSPGSAAEHRVALVIGNGAYGVAPLRNPVNDARAMAEALGSCGFDVVKLEDATRPEMQEAIRQFGDRIREGGAGLFYFAGHGIQAKGRNYLVPVDANLTREDQLEAGTVPLDGLLAELDLARNRVNILILDACRNDPFGQGLGAGQPGFAPVDAPAGTYLAFATSPGGTAADGGGDNSLYTRALLHQLTVPGLKLEEVFKRTRSEVLTASAQQQTPWENSSVVGDFFFVPGQAPAALEPPTLTAGSGSPAPAAMAQATPAVAVLPPPPVATAQVGGLLVSVNAPGSQVYVNGTLEGTASLTSALSVPGLPAGAAQVRVEAPGFAPLEESFSIQVGQWTQAQLQLRRYEGSPAYLDLASVLSADAGAPQERAAMPPRWRPGPPAYLGLRRPMGPVLAERRGPPGGGPGRPGGRPPR